VTPAGQPVEEWEGVLPLISLTRSQNDRQRAPEPVGDTQTLSGAPFILLKFTGRRICPLPRTTAAWSARGRPECWLRRLWGQRTPARGRRERPGGL